MRVARFAIGAMFILGGLAIFALQIDRPVTPTLTYVLWYMALPATAAAYSIWAGIRLIYAQEEDRRQ